MKKTLIFPLLMLFVVFSCSSKFEQRDVDTTVRSLACIKLEKPSPNKRKLTKDGKISFTTKDPKTATLFLKGLSNKYQAIISKESSDTYGNNKSYKLILEVPAAKFDSITQEIEKYDGVVSLDNKSVDITDVTEEYIDLEAHMRIKKASEQKLLGLLSQAKNLTETLAVEEKLTNLRAEIEGEEGRYKYLNQQIAFSTLEISYYEKEKRNTTGNQFWNAFTNGWDLFIDLLIGILNLWLIIIVTIAAIWGIRKYFKRRKAKKAAKS